MCHPICNSLQICSKVSSRPNLVPKKATKQTFEEMSRLLRIFAARGKRFQAEFLKSQLTAMFRAYKMATGQTFEKFFLPVKFAFLSR